MTAETNIMNDVPLLPLPLTDGWEPGCPYPEWVNVLLTDYARANLAELQREIDEQCRLNSIGAERELALATKVSELQREVEALRAEVAVLRVGAENKRLHYRDLLDRERERAERLDEALREAKELIEELTGDPNYERWDALLREQETDHG